MGNKKRRQAIKALGMGAPAIWAKPAVNSVILPAHANTSGIPCVTIPEMVFSISTCANEDIERSRVRLSGMSPDCSVESISIDGPFLNGDISLDYGIVAAGPSRISFVQLGFYDSSIPNFLVGENAFLETDCGTSASRDLTMTFKGTTIEGPASISPTEIIFGPFEIFA